MSRDNNDTSLQYKILFISLSLIIIMISLNYSFGNSNVTEIVYGGDNNFPPYEFIDKSGQPAGFNIDLIRYIALKQGINIRFKLMPWIQVRDRLKSGEIDIAAMYRSAQRAAEVEFSIPHELVYHEMYVRKGSIQIRTLDDLKNLRVLVENRTYSVDVLKSLGYGDNLIQKSSEPEALRSLSLNEGDVAIVTQTSGRPFQERSQIAADITPTGSPILLTEYAFVSNLGRRNLIEMINDGIVDAKESGEYEIIYNKWIKPDSVIAKWIRLLIIILGCTGVIIILFISWNVVLRKKISRKTAELREEFDKLSKTQIALAENERKLRQAQKMESVGRMASGLAHDFNNILTVILNYADFLRQDLLNSEHDTTFVDEILSASERASRLSRRLLTFCRDKPADKVQINLNQTIYELSGMIQQLIGEENTLSLSIPEKNIYFSADRTGIEQVLLNLAANARDAMTEKGTLTIALSEEHLDSNNSYNLNKGKYASIQVSDTGCGMKEEVLSHISEPFFTTKEIGKGTGLGLSSSFSVIVFHGGTVRVHSEVGKGSVFNILLPASTNTDPVYNTSQQHHYKSNSTDKVLTILFVEDDDTLRHATRTALARYGFNVFDAANGESALAIFNKTNTIDAVITDVVMPKLNGPLMVGKIRTIHPSLPVLYVSGYVQKENEIDLNSSNTLFLSKPYTNEQLIDSIFDLFK